MSLSKAIGDIFDDMLTDKSNMFKMLEYKVRDVSQVKLLKKTLLEEPTIGIIGLWEASNGNVVMIYLTQRKPDLIPKIIAVSRKATLLESMIDEKPNAKNTLDEALGGYIDSELTVLYGPNFTSGKQLGLLFDELPKIVKEKGDK